jgi:hypothetical protein
MHHRCHYFRDLKKRMTVDLGKLTSFFTVSLINLLTVEEKHAGLTKILFSLQSDEDK